MNKRGRRRGQGEGSIYQRDDGRWAAIVDLGWQDGKRRRKFVYGRTRAEAAAKLTQALKHKQDGQEFVDERTTVEQFLASWLAGVKPALKPRTWTRYEQYARLHTIPSLGRVRLVKLGPQHLQRLYAERLKAGLSPRSVLHLHRFLHRALDQAMRWGAVPRNVTDLVDPPRVRRHVFSTLSAEQALHLLSTARGHRDEALLVMALTTGLREGELLGMRWADVDLVSGAVHLQTKLEPSETGGWQLEELKNDQGRRKVLLTRLAVDALTRHRTRQATERLARGPAWEDLDLVFPNTVGRPILPQNLLRRSFYPLLERAGLPRLRFHDLRHSTATLLLAQGVHAKIVSELLGHTDIGITLNLYSHVTATMQWEAIDALDGLLGSQLGSQSGQPSDDAPSGRAADQEG
jgi:integrase